MAVRRKQPTRTVLTTAESLPGAALTASVTLGVLNYVGVPTWAELSRLVGEHDKAVLDKMSLLFLTPDQENALRANPAVVHAVRRKNGSLPRVTVAACDACGEWVAVTGAAPTTCTMTPGCKGSLSKPRDASRSQVPFEDDEPEPVADEHCESVADVDELPLWPKHEPRRGEDFADGEPQDEPFDEWPEEECEPFDFDA